MTSWQYALVLKINWLRLWLLALAATIATAATASDDRFTLRNTYLDAREALSQGRTATYAALAKQLDDYPLRPYLDYYRLRARLSSASTNQVLEFYRANGNDLPVAKLLYNRWLRLLGQRRQWQTLKAHYEPTSSATVQCYHLRALYGTGEKDLALERTTNLWLQPKSQPKACDPLFAVWRNSKFFTEEVAWQRLHGAIDANERTLARYLTRFFSGSNKRAAEAYYRVHVAPSSVAQSKRHSPETAKMRAVIEHGLRRLAGRDAERAAQAWRDYKRSGQFSDQASSRIDQLIAAGLAEENTFPGPAERVSITNPAVLEDIATAAIHTGNWAEAQYWIARLPADVQAKSQWRYWLARALMTQPELRDSAQAVAREKLTELAAQRHYYGFMAARLLGVPGSMNIERTPLNGAQLTQLRRHPNIARAVELFALGDDLNGRREWYRALDTLEPAKQLTAAELAYNLGLTALAIRSANIAEARNHLHLRFPVAHEPAFRRASLRSTLPVPLLMAIARQESAMEPNARSSANARGLMQLLPTTAELVARRAGMSKPSVDDLHDPGTNIALGSYHLAWLVDRFDGQVPLAVAAYNAGEHRVDRWLKESDGLPMDQWIETIPFTETRNYVKNVLAFRHVYAHKLATPTPMLGNDEQVVSTP